jgi:cytochrome c oxidase subunit IV
MSTAEAEVPKTDEEERHDHPSPRQYVFVAVILAIVTAIEVGIYYIDYFKENSNVLIAFLLAFAVVKFIMVALWFMHLRFDAHLFRRFFITGVILAIIIFGIVLWFFFTHGGAAPNAPA